MRGRALEQKTGITRFHICHPQHMLQSCVFPENTLRMRDLYIEQQGLDVASKVWKMRDLVFKKLAPKKTVLSSVPIHTMSRTSPLISFSVTATFAFIATPLELIVPIEVTPGGWATTFLNPTMAVNQALVSCCAPLYGW